MIKIPFTIGGRFYKNHTPALRNLLGRSNDNLFRGNKFGVLVESSLRKMDVSGRTSSSSNLASSSADIEHRMVGSIFNHTLIVGCKELTHYFVVEFEPLLLGYLFKMGFYIEPDFFKQEFSGVFSVGDTD